MTKIFCIEQKITYFARKIADNCKFLWFSNLVLSVYHSPLSDEWDMEYELRALVFVNFILESNLINLI